MTKSAPTSPPIAIACGGTGGHLFPGLAVADQLVRRGCAVMLLISPKPVDQQAVKTVSGMDIVTLPAVGLEQGAEIAFVRGFTRAYRTVRKRFQPRPPRAVLAMGGFTSAPPVLAARRLGARTFLHESNTIPGRANRWLSWLVHRAFVGFPSAAAHLHNRCVTVTGTPVRPQFQPQDPALCRTALGLDPSRPVVLVMGGSQGARGINELVVRSLPLLAEQLPDLQWLHLAAPADAGQLAQAYADRKLNAAVQPFFASMELALGAATVALCRAGASSLAELAAMRLPPVLVPYPAAADNHQFHNARAFEATGAARLLEQNSATPEILARLLSDMVRQPALRENMQRALAQWHAPQAAQQIADLMLEAVGIKVRTTTSLDSPSMGAAGLPARDAANHPPGPGLSRGCRLQVGDLFPSPTRLGVVAAEAPAGKPRAA
jgi:UDP-N-acetylglucosamine--N-acetylmuramyl-(pentapeptide) pyrophosphoryl-undecaprenol N-acetylglucosamine transferase